MNHRTRRANNQIWPATTARTHNGGIRHHEEDYNGVVEPEDVIGPAAILPTDEATVIQ